MLIGFYVKSIFIEALKTCPQSNYDFHMNTLNTKVEIPWSTLGHISLLRAWTNSGAEVWAGRMMGRLVDCGMSLVSGQSTPLCVFLGQEFWSRPSSAGSGRVLGLRSQVNWRGFLWVRALTANGFIWRPWGCAAPKLMSILKLFYKIPA